MKCKRLTLIAMVIGGAWAQPAIPEAKPFTPKAPPEQPIPFSHKKHVAIGVKCLDCHAIPSPGDLAGYPGVATCMGCHITVKKDSEPIQKLTAYAKEHKRIPWAPVYRLPRFVYFSHQTHHKEAGVDCAVCHGAVAERDAIGQEKSIAMDDCMKCHDQYKASNRCDLCHDSH